jgi:hypothetical protein
MVVVGDPGKLRAIRNGSLLQPTKCFAFQLNLIQDGRL